MMAIDFEAYLTAPFRWPTEQDTLFAPATGGDNDALLSEDVDSRFFRMVDGYKRAADALVDAAAADPRNRDSLVYPIVFCYRHYLELVIKETISRYGPRVDINPDWLWQKHDITKLWGQFILLLERCGIGSAGEYTAQVGYCVAEFSNIDERSFSFRFPTDRAGKALSLNLSELDLTNLKDVKKGVSNYFSGICDHICDLRNA
jgi:hypothetical protein